MTRYYTDMTIEEALPLAGSVGYVYPDNEDSYYLRSRYDTPIEVNCADGSFYTDFWNDPYSVKFEE